MWCSGGLLRYFLISGFEQTGSNNVSEKTNFLVSIPTVYTALQIINWWFIKTDCT